MLSVGIGEIQKNTSMFTNITEAIQIVDKRKKEILAMVYPIKKHSVIDSMAGKYKDQITPSSLSFEKIKEQAITQAMEEKYGLSS